MMKRRDFARDHRKFPKPSKKGDSVSALTLPAPPRSPLTHVHAQRGPRSPPPSAYCYYLQISQPQHLHKRSQGSSNRSSSHFYATSRLKRRCTVHLHNTNDDGKPTTTEIVGSDEGEGFVLDGGSIGLHLSSRSHELDRCRCLSRHRQS